MLDAMRPLTDRAPIGQAMNAHGNGDHWFGNGVLPEGIPIVASAAALEEMRAIGPAHTAGDANAYVPDADVVFTGDILFIEGTPIMWVGPVSNWLAACDRIVALGAP